MSLFTPSGGLVYHLRALRHRHGIWAPYRAALGQWLERCLAPADELVLVGPSAGHCLPLAHLARFRRLLVLEPDRLARWLLELRLPRVRLEFEHRDLLLAPLLDGGPGLDTLLERRPGATVLFCNLLGQLHWDLSEPQARHFRDEFRRRIWPLLATRRWASFHDRWSVEGNESEALRSGLSFPRLPGDDELGVACFGATGTPLLALDHETSQLFPEALPRCYFGWQLTPRTLHIVEGASSPGV